MEFIELWDYFWFYFPLGIIGLWRWGVWTFKKILALFYKPIPVENCCNDLTLSIITPVYNEDPKLFKQALNSWQGQADEIIAVIDETDKPCIEIFRDFAKDKPYAKMIVTSTPGKRPALATGIRTAKSEIVALVDSDTVWEKNIRSKLLAPFSNPKIGGVVTRQNCIEHRSIWQKITDIFWDLRNADEWPSQIAAGNVVTCLSGRTALYYRKVLLLKLDEFLNETILGKRKESGDDKCLTRLIQKDGWHSYYQRNAQVYSSAAQDFRTFIKQRVRWTRNSYGSDITSLWEGWAWKHPFLAFYMIDRFISPFTLLLAPIYFCAAIYLNHWTIALVIFCWWLLSRGVKIFPYLRRHPRDIWILPIYTAVNFLTAVTKIYALVTIREQEWIRGSEERQDKKGIFNLALSVFFTGLIICGLAVIVIFGF